MADSQCVGPAVQSAIATQSSQLPLPEELQLPSSGQPEYAESVASGEGRQQSSAGHRLAALPPPEQMQQSMAHPGGILSAAGGAAVLSLGENSVQGSPGLGFPGIGSTPAAHTIKGMCSLPAAMQAEQTSADSGRASEGTVCLSSPAVISLGSAGSPGIGSTPAADTIKALEAAAYAAASQHDQGPQASPGLASTGRPLAVGSTPAWNTIKALQRDHSSKSVSILASGCSETAEAYAPSAPGEYRATCLAPALNKLPSNSAAQVPCCSGGQDNIVLRQHLEIVWKGGHLVSAITRLTISGAELVEVLTQLYCSQAALRLPSMVSCAAPQPSWHTSSLKPSLQRAEA